jgi:plasmid stabilization system protein ParE
MARLRILSSARIDLNDIAYYIARESRSTATARQFVNSLRLKCGHLAALPGHMGRPRPALGADIRSFAFRGYVILFRYADGVLEVINVMEGHRDIEAQSQDSNV